jgi:hypothetical protein
MKSVYALADETKRLINGLIAYLRKSRPTPVPSGQIRELPQPYLADGEQSTAAILSDHQTKDN